MYLPQRPTYYVKDGNRRAVYYTVDARQLSEKGWVVEGKQIQEPITEEVATEEPIAEPEDINNMTKAELVDYAKRNNISIDTWASKAVIFETICNAENG